MLHLLSFSLSFGKLDSEIGKDAGKEVEILVKEELHCFCFHLIFKN